jgi:carboxypeptidase C (cathepsin A)
MKHGIVILLLALILPASAASTATGPLGVERHPRVEGVPPSDRGRDTRDTIAGPRRSAAAPECSVTEHTMLVQGRPIRYRATAGYLPIQRDSGEPIANIFFVAYERLEGTDANSSSNPPSAITSSPASTGGPHPKSNRRPLTFAFNGGPGASAVWLHMGAFGPKRAVLANDGTALPPSDQLVDNEHTWLEFTDLVFVDPVGTGFSRSGPGVDADQFYEVHKDIEIAADFVRLFVTQHERWLSPQFLVGESYGTARAVGMARRLQDRYGLYVNGLILLSSALNLAVISFDPGNDLPYALSLPSYMAVAQYHGRLRERSSSDLEQSLQRVQVWALGDYLAALAQGRLLSPAQSREIAKRLAEYTGLPEDMIVRNRLRINTVGFAQELLGRENRVLGLLDGRVTGSGAQLPRRPWIDPALFIVEGPFVATFNSYVRTQLCFKTDRPYIFLSAKANESWNWGPGRNGYFNIAPVLAEAIGLDNRLRVFAAAGYYDLTTPYLGQEYVFNHLDLPPGLEQNITFRRYHAGHQIYTSQDALRQLTDDVRTWVPKRDTSRLGGAPQRGPMRWGPRAPFVTEAP